MTGSRDTLSRKAGILAGMLVLMWALQLFNFIFGGLFQYGIVPREWSGLRGILFAPFLHGSFFHLIANTVPFIVLGWLVILRGSRDFVFVTVVVMLTGGLGTWLTGAPHSIHIGASGVIFGYLGFLVSCGIFERRIGSILVSLGVGAVYGSLIFGVLPGQAGISWQGHLFGLGGGVLAAKMLANRQRNRRTRTAW